MGNFVSKNGSVPFGFFKEPSGEINYQDYFLRDPFRRLLPEAAREEQFVHFHFMGFTSDRFISGCSLSKTSRQTAVFFYLFDRQSCDMRLKKGCVIKSDEDATLTLNPDSGISQLRGRDMDVLFDLKDAGSTRCLQITIEGVEILSLQIQDDRCNTLRMCTPTGPTGWTFVQKIAGAKASGRLHLDGDVIDLAQDQASAHYDFTAGFLRRDTFWNWACITGFDQKGQVIGLNLSNGVNETGVGENVIWIDGQMQHLPTVLFDYDPENLNAPWRICDQHGRIDLTFHPDGAYIAYYPKGETPVDFSQLFGKFSGQIRIEDEEIIEIVGLPGFTERQYSVWW